MRIPPRLGDHVFPKPDTLWRGEKLAPNYPLLVINVARWDDDAVVVVRDPVWFKELTKNGQELVTHFGIMLCLSEIASVEAAI